ncbi:MAG: ribosome-associated translation inhibitor RaiA [Patescibacteria group bacterium]|jgi:putative sigma-54 modulation protein
MNIQIKFENINSDERLKIYAQEKVAMLAKYLGDIQVLDVKVKLSMTSNHHQKGDIYECEIALALPGETLRVTKTTSDIYKAIDKVKDHLERAIKKYKET